MAFLLELKKDLKKALRDSTLYNGFFILNLPSANYCRKRSELTYSNGNLTQSCKDCITQNIGISKAYGKKEAKEIIDFFYENYGIKYITINGRGDPFHPLVKDLNLFKIKYAYKNYGIKSYVFNAFFEDDKNCYKALIECSANVMISLYGNDFIDADFFRGKEYADTPFPLRNNKKIAENIRYFLKENFERNNFEENITNVGMNYVLSLKDLKDSFIKVSDLQKEANKNRIYFVSNLPFTPYKDKKIQTILRKAAIMYSDFNEPHSTFVDGVCQMGAGSSLTIDYDGSILRCPYLENKDNDGNFFKLNKKELKDVLKNYRKEKYSCVVRKF